ncbi:MAG TPA: exo-beta-N-acetylmuramidase NamZ domain-containing protein [Terriglobia bacterium]|nr:exo-beta-N-acetylmuramidase NamZ domain-containing protein [Terriglobia bacterium]
MTRSGRPGTTVAVALALAMVGLGGAAFAQMPARHAARRATQALAAPKSAGAAKLAAIAPVVEQAVREGKAPGVVVLIGHNGRVVYRRAFGNRALVPRRLPMRVDTIFDLASLTKVIATTPSVMQLLEQGKLRLEDPVANYWPEFGVNGKDEITVRELMTHFSGLPPDLELKPAWTGYETAMKMIEQTAPIVPPGTRFIYSDVNYETLGELVRRLSGEPLNVYAARHIFRPLGMRTTGFLPPASLRARIAPTQYENGRTGPLLWGVVHDPTAHDMGGVAGHAGLFSTANDLALYAQTLLDGGRHGAARILSAASVVKMSTPQTPPGKTAVRGLGWDIDSPFSSNRGDLFPVGSFGHSGFTGTSIWIDPFSNTYVIVLANAVHPIGEGNVIALRGQIANIAAAAFGRAPSPGELEARLSLTSHTELENSYRMEPARNGRTETGIDVLEAENFAPLQGLRVGLVTNQSGRDAAGRRTIDVLAGAPGVKLAAIFSPEHGLAGAADTRVASTRDPATGLPVYSLYGDTERPSDEMLAGLDALVYDIQDAGVRFYTFETTLGYTLEAAARKGLAYVVLDRPDPVGGFNVEGPLLDADQRSFVGYFPLPVRHGMTVGELAQMFNAEQHLGAKLSVIKMRDWRRTDWFDETGLAWVNPSPNLRNLTETTLYPGLGMIEGANVSVGRGTDTPFEVLGAPWMDSAKLAGALNARRIQGVRFEPADFTPSSSRYGGELCHGVQIDLVDRDALDSPELGAELAAALYKLFPNDFKLDATLALVGSRAVLDGIRRGRDPRRLAYDWEQDQLQAFRAMRARYLLY